MICAVRRKLSEKVVQAADHLGRAGISPDAVLPAIKLKMGARSAPQLAIPLLALNQLVGVQGNAADFLERLRSDFCSDVRDRGLLKLSIDSESTSDVVTVNLDRNTFMKAALHTATSNDSAFASQCSLLPILSHRHVVADFRY